MVSGDGQWRVDVVQRAWGPMLRVQRRGYLYGEYATIADMAAVGVPPEELVEVER